MRMMPILLLFACETEEKPVVEDTFPEELIDQDNDGYTSQDYNISSEETEIERTDRRWMHLHVIRTGVFPKLKCRQNNCTCKNLPDWP